MRPIKFRGKRLDNEEWVYGSLDLTDNSAAISWDRTDNDGDTVPWFANVGPATVGQFTGLPDKNGKEIYEDDIVNVRQGERTFDIVVKWSNEAMAFMACYADENQSPLSWFSDLRMYQLRVIGSIHDNPELLNEK